MVLISGLAAAIVAGPGHGSASAQEGCEFGNDGNDVVQTQTVPGVGRVTYVSRPHFVCAGGVQIWADSAVAYDERGMSHLMGSVRYREQARELHADTARYFSNEGRLQANGSVSVVDEREGSSIRDGDLVYLLETDFRDVAEMTVTTGADGIRPTALITPPARDTVAAADTAGAADTVESARPPPTPYSVIGDRIFLLGTGYFTASGSVEIVRDSLFAFADSAEYEEEGNLSLVGAARVEGAAYELTGRRILMSAAGGPSSEIHALRDARLTGENLLLTSAQIFVFLVDDALERLVATPIVRAPAVSADSADVVRPEATVDDFVLTADSLEVHAPTERIERVFAAGRARSVSTSRDSLNVERLPEVARTDWLEGDTVIVTFKPSPNAARENDREVEQIVARVAARSLYRLPPNDSAAQVGVDPPAVHYVVGDEIRIVMESGEVDAMHVMGQTQGVHLEPLRRVAPTDTSALATDSIARDTTSADTVKPNMTTPMSPQHDAQANTVPPADSFSSHDTTMTAVAPADDSRVWAKGLTKVYRNRKVVDNVDISVNQGEIVGLLGPNGAGKTTTFYMMVGLIPPNEGSVHLDSEELTRTPMYQRARKGIGYLAQEPSVFRKLSVEDNVLAILETLGLPSAEEERRLEDLLAELGLQALRKSKAYSLSGGERRRLEITRALVQRPKFMLLDEPFAGIDPIAVHDIQEIVRGLKDRRIGVVISDHNVEQTLEIVDRAYIMYEGKIRVSGTVSELVWNDEVAEIYLGPALTARMRGRYGRPGE